LNARLDSIQAFSNSPSFLTAIPSLGTKKTAPRKNAVLPKNQAGKQKSATRGSLHKMALGYAETMRVLTALILYRRIIAFYKTSVKGQFRKNP